MARTIPPTLATSRNARVLAHLKDLSAHDDIASTLTDAVRPLGDVQVFCPDAASYRYVLVATKGTVFGFAVGMDTIAFRLDDRMRGRALTTGSLPYPECGDDWVAVVHGRPDSDWPAVDVAFWARRAYMYARR